MGRSVPSAITCDNTTPIPYGEASHATLSGLVVVKTKLKNISTTTTQEACGRASTTSQALKGINQLL